MKKLQNFFTSKGFFLLLTTCIQIFLWLGIVYWIGLALDYAGIANVNVALWTYFLSEVIGIILSFAILMKNDHPSYKIVWLLFLILLPSVGIFCYLFFGRHKIRYRLRRNYLNSQIDLRHIMENTSFAEDIKLSSSRESSTLAKNIVNSGKFPAFTDTHNKFYGNISDLWAQLLSDLTTAQKFIYIEMYIIRNGLFWESVRKLLVEKSLSGVDVRIIYDDFGTSFTKKEREDLSDAGIKFFIFNKMGITFDASKNNRTHRKMIIIDGDVAYTGGFNIADEYVNKVEKYGNWKDTGLRLEGPAVYSFTLMFLSFWQLQKNVKPLDRGFGYAPDISASHPEAHGVVQPLSSGPLKNYRLIELAFMQMIANAKKSVYITTPYLILDHEIETMLCIAAQSGIDVRIIMPGIPDKKIIFAISRSFYPNLLKAGVKIYEYSDGFVHAKELIVDGRRAFIGTCNMDFRSFFLHFECGAIMYDTVAITEMEDDFLEILDKCRQVDFEWATSLKWYQRLWRGIARLFAPLF